MTTPFGAVSSVVSIAYSSFAAGCSGIKCLSVYVSVDSYVLAETARFQFKATALGLRAPPAVWLKFVGLCLASVDGLGLRC